MRAIAARLRFVAPLAVAFGCLIGSLFVGALLSWLMLLLAFGLVLDGATAMFERAGSTGNMTTHRS